MTQDGTHLTITLTGRRPVTIKKAEWPIIASAKDRRGLTVDEERRDKLFVRRHRDGRALVYGIPGNGVRGGVLLDDGDVDDDAIANAVSRVGSELLFEPSLINACLAELPAEAI